MRTFKIVGLLGLAGVAGCKTHLQYDYYAPSVPGIAGSDLTDREIPGRDDCLKILQPKSFLMVRCVDDRMFGPHPMIYLGIFADADASPSYLSWRSEEIEISFVEDGSRRIVHHRDRGLQDGRGGLEMTLIDLRDRLPAFEMHIPSGVGGPDDVRIAFKRKRSDYWEYVQLQ